MSNKVPKTPSITVVIDDEQYYPLSVPNKRLMQLLEDIYGTLWTEAYYDPANEHTKKFAQPLAEKMAEVNKIIGFK